MNWLYLKEDHYIRFFRTKWNSPISFKWLRTKSYCTPQWTVQFWCKYVNIYLGRFEIKIYKPKWMRCMLHD
ncbi:hypothetical protein SP15_213 [Bacillus phage SP-15]|uniref:Uncharacterized protein n=1 Tax=Bacillus phage SP-15 TaxID=1792032 RepID=A0A127AWP6_9CAUD|nr:hypothetical protein SP15_213 [Bacillus phage SP-15]AMM45013.1 hypothetical protein SP15_213 [Bacillus phage SP-15]